MLKILNPQDIACIRVAAATVAFHALLSNMGVNQTPSGCVQVAFKAGDEFVDEALRRLKAAGL